jgi:four helix bundle protein
MRAASVSVMGNIAEGFDRGGRSEFHQFLSVAKGSAGELRNHLYAALDAGYLTQAQFDQLLSLAREVAALTSRLRTAVQKQRDGQKRTKGR